MSYLENMLGVVLVLGLLVLVGLGVYAAMKKGVPGSRINNYSGLWFLPEAPAAEPMRIYDDGDTVTTRSGTAPSETWNVVSRNPFQAVLKDNTQLFLTDMDNKGETLKI